MKMLRYVVFVIGLMASFAYGQSIQFESFDNMRPDTLFASWHDGPCTLVFTGDAATKKEGAASMKNWSVLAHSNAWGAASQVGMKNHTKPYDWSNAESLSIWINVTKAPTHPEVVSFRLQVTEDEAGADGEVWVYQNNTILDAAKGWVNLKIPLVERTPTDGSLSPDSSGFCIAPAAWGWPPFINKKFDANRISTWYLTELTITDVADSLEVYYDDFRMEGSKPVPVTIFNGVNFTGVVSGDAWAWGSSTVGIEKGIGVGGPLTNAVKWTQGTNPGWGADSGYTGWGVNLNSTNMVGSWNKDTLHFKLKCAPNGVGANDSLRVQLEGAGKKGKVFDLIDDDTWHQYNIAIKDLVFQDGTKSIDSAHITVFGIMAQKTGKVGRVIYVTDVWSGNPVFDVIPPVAPTGISTLGGNFTNIVSWTDVPNEVGAKYNVYASEKPFTSVDDSTVEDLPPYKIAAGVSSATHQLRSPKTDQNVTYYYGVTAMDQDGNIGAPGLSTAVTTKAKGVATIAVAPPAGIAIDGDVTEWETAGIQPIVISSVPKTGQGHVEGGVVTDDADLSVKSYIATDANNLYVAFDVTDDIVGKTNDSLIYSKGSYGVDGCDLFIGLYDWRGKRHTGYTKGATPDYHFRMTRFGALLDNNGKYLDHGTASYKWVEKVLTPGYIIEAKIPFQMLADSLGAGVSVFKPVEGMRIPIDYSINDNDDKNPTGQPWESREGIICYSPNNKDNSWQDMWKWSYTWIGNRWTAVQRNEGIVATSFELSQNYPNPFNPTTSIRYSIPKASVVSLKVFDILGREVMTVVNQYQEEGSYTVSLDATKLSSGMYVYRLESNSFALTKKMMLLK